MDKTIEVEIIELEDGGAELFVTISDEIYQKFEALAKEQKLTIEKLLYKILKERIENLA